LTSYKSDRDANDARMTIWQACRATSAASTFFDPISIGMHEEQYLDGATGANNPVRELWTAAKDLWPEGHLEDKIKCLVSIGTGQPSLEPFGESLVDVATTLLAIATDTERTAEVFAREHRDLAREKRYFRFNVEKGLEKIGLEEFQKRSILVSATRRYLESQAVYENLLACGEQLSSKEGWFVYA
jgi:predicted acylesterase/phospholipase RssA